MTSNKNIKIVKWALSMLYLGIVGYIFSLQTVYHKAIKKQAVIQHCDSIPQLAQRGKIFDTKNRPIVYNQSSASIRILPNQIRPNCADTIADILAAFNLKPRNEILNELNSRTRLFWFKKHIDYQIVDQLRKELHRHRVDNSVYVTDDLKRVYPFGPMLGSLIGFYGEEQGLAGIEYSFNTLLSGTPGWFIIQKDALGNKYYWPSYPSVKPIDGYDLVLTIDLDIQSIAYHSLAKFVDDFQALHGSVIVVDVDDGAILALAEYPDYDPQNYQNYPAQLWKISSIADEFEPGSVYKLLICATALCSPIKQQLISRTYDVSNGYLLISGKKIKDVHNNGIISFDEIFIKSSNIGVSLLSQMLSPTDFYFMERRFGFGVKTGIELAGEAKGFIDRPEKLTPLRFANNCFGQGVRVTLLQLSMAYLSIANNGLLLKPYIIKQIRNKNKVIYQGKRQVVRRVLPEDVAKQIKEILAEVVIRGTGRAAQIPEYLVCGKTGTAQKIEPDGKYSSKRSIMTFIGFFPKQKPKYLIAVLIDEPKISRFAGEVTCPLFQIIAQKIILLNNKEFHSNQLPIVMR
ncbi:MAG: penicillin-binding protein 2 [candidate division WOR-3 bacterium]